MSLRPVSLLLLLALAVAACSGEAATSTTRATTTTTTSTTTSTTVPPTTTTTLAFGLEGAPEALNVAIEDFYNYAAGSTDAVPNAPTAVVDKISPREMEMPEGGTAATGAFAEKAIAVVQVGEDVFLTVNDNGWKIVGGEWPSLSIPAYYGDGPRHIAVIGSDARPGEDVARSRADSIHFVALDGNEGGAVVGLPRDSYVSVPGVGTTKITNSLSSGGPDALMGGLTELTGLPLEGYVMTGFSGFESLLGSVLGGVSVRVPFPINDRWAKAYLDAGRQDLDGAQALGFARARKTVPNGDFTRSEHQGMILISAAQAVRAMGMSAIPKLMEMSEPFLITNMTPEDLLTFSAMAITANLDEIPNLVAPGSPGRAGSASVVYLSSSADDLWADLADGLLDN